MLTTVIWTAVILVIILGIWARAHLSSFGDVMYTFGNCIFIIARTISLVIRKVYCWLFREEIEAEKKKKEDIYAEIINSVFVACAEYLPGDPMLPKGVKGLGGILKFDDFGSKGFCRLPLLLTKGDPTDDVLNLFKDVLHQRFYWELNDPSVLWGISVHSVVRAGVSGRGIYVYFIFLPTRETIEQHLIDYEIDKPDPYTSGDVDLTDKEFQ